MAVRKRKDADDHEAGGATSGPAWVAGTFPIGTTGGPQQREGYVWRNFGIDYREEEIYGQTGWILTHIPSGCVVAAELEAFGIAAALAERIDPLIDWSAPDVPATKELREKLQRALDCAYNDYYAGRAPKLTETS